MILMTKNTLYQRALFFYLIAHICLNFTTSRYIEYRLPLTSSIQKRYELFEPLDTNLVRAMFTGQNGYHQHSQRNTDNGDDSNGGDEYYTNSKSLGSLMRYG
ncbi:unnamed protein product [Heterobilharzia americana]|nr:unnamed protein product [Heterobilharzia americana]CAH8441021.1 unnamed protein product [Heterobilharzia americana]